MRKISAHYCLLPDGSLGKMPVISVDNSNIITDIKILGDDFKEEQGMEYYGGVLIPGFIEDFRGITLSDENIVERVKMINRLYSNGSLRYICYPDFRIFPSNFKGKVFHEKQVISINKTNALPKISAWELIKEQCLNSNVSVPELIHDYNSKAIKSIPEEVKWGRFEEGVNPGILLIRGLDYKGMKMRENTTIKILIS